MSETATGESTSNYPFKPLSYEPVENCRVPMLRKKALDEVMIVR